jgi:tRNA A37 N6-isopentenylltransferase MiaA
MLRLVPINQKEAFQFVAEQHRHHLPPVGCKFCIAVADEEAVRGVAIVGRPVARMLDDGFTLEVTRLATDGAYNACSMLYAASWKAARALGYKRLITYILKSEPGTSLKAAGWKLIGEAGGGSWSVPSRPRVDKHPTQVKLRWEAA